MKIRNFFTTGIDLNNRLTLPRDIYTQIVDTLQHEDESEEIKRAVNLIPIRIGKARGIFLIPYIYYIRHFYRLLERLPLLFSYKAGFEEPISEDIDEKGRVYIREDLLSFAGLTKIRDEIASKAGKVVVVNSMCGWLVWSASHWDAVKNKILVLHLFKKHEEFYVKLGEWCCFFKKKGGLKKIISSSLLTSQDHCKPLPDFLILEDISSTYLFSSPKDLYKRICLRPRDLPVPMSFSAFDYRCGVPKLLILKSQTDSRVEIQFRKADFYLDFISENIPEDKQKGNIKAVFEKEKDVYVLSDIC